MERVNSEYAAIAKNAAVPDQDETARNIAIATITAAKINKDRAAAAATKLLKGLKVEGGTVYGILAGTPSRGKPKPIDPKYEQSPLPLADLPKSSCKSSDQDAGKEDRNSIGQDAGKEDRSSIGQDAGEQDRSSIGQDAGEEDRSLIGRDAGKRSQSNRPRCWSEP